LCVWHNVIQARHLKVARLAGRGSHAGKEVEGRPRVTSTQTVCAYTTESILRTTWRAFGAFVVGIASRLTCVDRGGGCSQKNGGSPKRRNHDR